MSGWRAEVNAICAALPGAELSDPWGGGHDAWKVGGKLFAVQGMEPGLSVKCADMEIAAMLIEAGAAVRAPYFHRSWVRLAEGTALDEVRHRVEISYDLIRAALPKKVREGLEARG